VASGCIEALQIVVDDVFVVDVVGEAGVQDGGVDEQPLEDRGVFANF